METIITLFYNIQINHTKSKIFEETFTGIRGRVTGDRKAGKQEMGNKKSVRTSVRTDFLSYASLKSLLQADGGVERVWLFKDFLNRALAVDIAGQGCQLLVG